MIDRLPLATWRLLVAIVRPGRLRPRLRRTSTCRGRARHAGLPVRRPALPRPGRGRPGPAGRPRGRGCVARSPPCWSWSAWPTSVRRWRRPTEAGRSLQHVVDAGAACSSTHPPPGARRAVVVAADLGRCSRWPTSSTTGPRDARRLRPPSTRSTRTTARPSSACSRPPSRSASSLSPLCGSDSRRTIAIYRDRSLTVGRGSRWSRRDQGCRTRDSAGSGPVTSTHQWGQHWGGLGTASGATALGPRGRGGRVRRRGWPASSGSPRATSSSAGRGSAAATSGRPSSTCSPRSR